MPDPARLTRPGAREERVLLLLAWAGFLTTEQVRLAGGYPTVRRAQRKLRALLDRGLTRVELQGGALHRPSIHLPTAAAKERLTEDGRLDSGYRLPRLPRAQKLGHALLVRDAFAAFAAADHRRVLRMEDFRFDSDLTREEPFRSAGLVPDAIATVRLPNGETRTLAVEADAGTETVRTLRRKFASWCAVLDVWHAPSVTLVALAEREGRRRTLSELMIEARVTGGLALLVTHLAAFVSSLGAPHERAVRADRAERRTPPAQVPRVIVISHGVPGPFRGLR